MSIRRRITWARSPRNGYEVSSKGDRRFSAFFARMPDGRTLEAHYQCDVKGYATIAEGKGKPPLTKQTRTELWFQYLALWQVWAEHHPAEINELREILQDPEFDCTLCDRFATTPVNQAAALAYILNDLP